MININKATWTSENGTKNIAFALSKEKITLAKFWYQRVAK